MIYNGFEYKYVIGISCYGELSERSVRKAILWKRNRPP